MRSVICTVCAAMPVSLGTVCLRWGCSALEMTSVMGRSTVALIVTSVRDRAAARLIHGACKLLGERAGAIASERASAEGASGN